MSASTSAYLQVSGDEQSNRNEEASYQIREYMNSEPTVIARLYNSQRPKEDKKKGKKDKKGKKTHKDKIQQQLDDFDLVMRGTNSSPA